MCHEDEDRAAAIVAYVLCAKYTRRDYSGCGGLASHDFDLHFEDGRPNEPLEITTAADTGALSSRQILRTRAIRAATGLTRAWTVVAPSSLATGEMSKSGKAKTKPYDFDRAHPLAERALVVCEGEGIYGIEITNGASRDVHAAQHLLWWRLDLRVGSSRPLGPGEEPSIEYLIGYGGAGRSQAIAQAVSWEANDPGNRGKLKGTAERRHLFVSLSTTSGDAWVAARDGALDELPELPTEITTVWVWAGDGRVFFSTPPEPWEARGIPEDVFNAPNQLALPDPP
jgi:hypothetical protein